MTRLIDRLRVFLRPQVTVIDLTQQPQTLDLAAAENALRHEHQLACVGTTIWAAQRNETGGIVAGSWKKLNLSKWLHDYLAAEGLSYLWTVNTPGTFAMWLVYSDLPPLPAGVLPAERILR